MLVIALTTVDWLVASIGALAVSAALTWLLL